MSCKNRPLPASPCDLANTFAGIVTIYNNTETPIYIDASQGSSPCPSVLYNGQSVSWTARNPHNVYSLQWSSPGASAFSQGSLSFGPCTKVSVDRGSMPENQQWYSMSVNAKDSNGNQQSFSQSTNGGTNLLPGSQNPCNKTITLTFSGTKPAFKADIVVTNNTDAPLTMNPSDPSLSPVTILAGKTGNLSTDNPNTTYALNWGNQDSTKGSLQLGAGTGVSLNRGWIQTGLQGAITANITATANGNPNNITQQAIQNSNQYVSPLKIFPIGGTVNVTFAGTWPAFNAKATIVNNTNTPLTLTPSLPDPTPSTIAPGEHIIWTTTQAKNTYTLNWGDVKSPISQGQFSFGKDGIGAQFGYLSSYGNLSTTLTSIAVDPNTGQEVTESITDNKGAWIQLPTDFSHGGAVGITFTGNFPADQTLCK